MAATTSRAEMPVFSYAQAAKGLPTTQSAKPASAESASKPEEPAADANTSTSSDTVTPETETNHEAEKPTATADKESDPTAATSQQVKPVVSGTSSPSVGTVSTLPKDDDSSSTPNGSSESTWDKQSQASAPEKANGAAEGAKGKSSEKAAQPPKELKAAPIPAVNVWQQRKEAQEAKAKAMAALKPPVSAPKSANAKNASTVSPISGDNQPDSSKAASKKKGADNAPDGAKDRKKTEGGKGRDDGSGKSGSRSNRQVQADAESADLAIPPVGDASSWPTPQVAQGEEKKKAQEKTEKSEKADKSPVIRPHGKEKWMPVPYVPSAVFTTPLPSAGRRGGRIARGGRDGGRGGAPGAAAAAAAGGDKAGSGQTAQGSAPKQASSADRARNEPAAGRANSLPAQARRSNSADAASGPEPRKFPQAADRSRGETRKGGDDANAATGRHVNGGESFPRQHRDAKAFSRSHEPSPLKAGDNSSKNAQVSGDARAGAHRFENGPKSADAYRDANGENHRDKEHTRPDRGRGSHRGRGGHYGGPQNAQFPNTHMPHHSFVPQKSFGFNDRQRSQQQQHGIPNGSQQGHRMSLRSPSLPNSASMYGAYPFPAEINTMYGYPAVHPGPMTAVPYQQYMEPFSLMSMISMQLEYYFSVDNLCKDLFLRKHMDSQGFVLLNFIAGFKRIKSLTEDFELLRHVSRQLRNVEYMVGDDGVDRLRPRERWEQWVLPIEQREPTAQNEGPISSTSTGKSDENAAPQKHVGGINGSIEDQSLPNGTGEPRLSKTPLSSAAPEFSPSNPLTAQNENANLGKSSMQLS